MIHRFTGNIFTLEPDRRKCLTCGKNFKTYPFPLPYTQSLQRIFSPFSVLLYFIGSKETYIFVIIMKASELSAIGFWKLQAELHFYYNEYEIILTPSHVWRRVTYLSLVPVLPSKEKVSMISSSLHSKPCPVLLFLVLLKHTSFASLIWSPSVPSFLPSYSHSVCLNFFNWLGRDPYSRPSHSWNFQSLTHWTCPLEKLFRPLLPVLFLN